MGTSVPAEATKMGAGLAAGAAMMVGLEVSFVSCSVFMFSGDGDLSFRPNWSFVASS